MNYSKDDFHAQLREQLESINCVGENRLKLILHVGTPKTGTTSLQSYFDKKQSKLRRKGILYPHNLEKLKHPTAPRHHWFERNLVSENFDYFLENFKNIIAQVQQNTHTIILSSEGIYNHWWDFSDESKSAISQLGDLFDTQVWGWFREPLEFVESYYKQCIRNPKIEGNLCYGRDLSIEQMLDIEWFARHLDYQGFVEQCEGILGEHTVSAFEYKGDVVREVLEKLGLNTPHDNPTPRQNKSLNNQTLALLRSINCFDLSAKDKELLMPHLKEMNSILENYSTTCLIDERSKLKIMSLYRPIKGHNL